MVTFSDCTLHEGVKPPDLVAAAKWSAYLNQSEVTAAIAYNFRGHGNPQDMAANMKVPIWRPNLESYGCDADL